MFERDRDQWLDFPDKLTVDPTKTIVMLEKEQQDDLIDDLTGENYSAENEFVQLMI